MSDFPTVPLNVVSGLSEQVLQVSGLAVDQTKNQPVLILSVDYLLFGESERKTVQLALSPPAAAQLSRMLRKAVKAYLFPEDNQESTQKTSRRSLT